MLQPVHYVKGSGQKQRLKNKYIKSGVVLKKESRLQ